MSVWLVLTCCMRWHCLITKLVLAWNVTFERKIPTRHTILLLNNICSAGLSRGARVFRDWERGQHVSRRNAQRIHRRAGNYPPNSPKLSIIILLQIYFRVNDLRLENSCWICSDAEFSIQAASSSLSVALLRGGDDICQYISHVPSNTLVVAPAGWDGVRIANFLFWFYP